MPIATKLPHWDMSAFFPGIESPEFQRAFNGLKTAINALRQLFDEARVQGGDGAGGAERFDSVVDKYNALMDQVKLIDSYIYAFTSTNTRDAAAQSKESELNQLESEIRKLSTRLTAWLGTLPLQELLTKSESARSHEFALRKASEAASHLMSPAEEDLASDLNTTGATAWGKLHGKVTSQIMVEFRGERLPMSAIRALAYDADADVRKGAYEAELAAWKEHETAIAAAINSIKGEVNTLSKRRGWKTPLQEALFRANINEMTLDAMMSAARESFPAFRRYLRAKSKALGNSSALPWYDIFAPIGRSESGWEYDDAMDFVAKNFGTYSEKMRDFALRSFSESWIDAEPRPGKVDGAYCMGVRDDVSRIMMNYKPAFGSVNTLAHELGHAYHNLCLAKRTHLQSRTPMTLAETASIFCETIVRRAALRELPEQARKEILEAALQAACQTVVDISSRFIFERELFTKRADRELGPEELSDAMLRAQKETYGDGLDERFLHPYMWAVKPHYYSTYSFYNFPYMFGLLFGLGLYTRYEQEPEEFKKSYDDLLSSTGLADAATLASRFGIDIATPEFWRGSLSQLERDIEEFSSASV